MPTHRIFETFARRVEEEMSPVKEEKRPTTKVCPVCEAEMPWVQVHAMTVATNSQSQTLFECDACANWILWAQNLVRDVALAWAYIWDHSRKHWGMAWSREGWIDESETQFSEKISSSMRDILSSGDKF